MTTTSDNESAQQRPPLAFQEAARRAEELLTAALMLLRQPGWPDGLAPTVRQLAPLGRARVSIVQAIDGVREAMR